MVNDDKNPNTILRYTYSELAASLRVLARGMTAGGVIRTIAVDGDGHVQVDVLSGGGGGGTEYTEATDTLAGGEGTLVLAQGSDSVGRMLNLNAAGDLKVSLDGESQAVTGPLTDAELRFAPVPVSGSVTATIQEPLSIDDNGGSITVDGTVDVSGTVAVDATGQGDVPVTLDGEAVVLGTGSAQIGKLAANDGVDIGDVDVLTLPAIGVLNTALADLETTYNNVTTSKSLTTRIDCAAYRTATLSFTLAVANSPTDIRFEVWVSPDGTANTSKLMNGPLGSLVYSTAAISSGLSHAITFPIAADEVDVKVIAVGTTLSATFTVSHCDLYLRE